MMLAVQIEFLPTPALGWALLLLATAWTLRAVRAGEAAPTLGWKWWVLVAVMMLRFRWPMLWVAHALNPDESQLIAGAMTLRHDPVFWRSVDGATAGPVEYYPLLPAAWADGFASYVIARLIAFAVVLGTAVFAGETLALLGGAALARVALLPALAAAAFTTDPDFAHYSTELMPMLLVAAAGYAAVRQDRSPSAGWTWLIGLLLGGVIWAKFQVVPIAAVLWALVALHEFRSGRARSLLPLVAGALVPALLCFGMVALTGQTEHMMVPYFLHNFDYVSGPQFPWKESVPGQWKNALTDGYLAFWFAGAMIFLVPFVLWAIRQAPAATRRIALVATLLFGVGLFCALVPRRLTAHHLLLVPLPLLWLTGAVLALAWTHEITAAARRKRLLIAGLCLVSGLVPQMALRAAGYNPFANMNAATDKPTRRQLVALVREFSDPGEPIAIWGWRCGLYVEAGRRQATRQAQTENQIYPTPFRPYFLRRYLEDLQAANPPVFADAVGPGNFAYGDRNVAHESFPPLRAWVQDRYTEIADLDGTRLYVRNDRLAARKSALSVPAHP